MVVFELIVVVFGVVYGYAKPGKQSKWQIFKTGILVGLLLALLFAVLGGLLGFQSVTAGFVGTGFFSILISVIWLTILFIVGVWIGDILE